MIHSFNHSFIQQIFKQYLLSSRHKNYLKCFNCFSFDLEVCYIYEQNQYMQHKIMVNNNITFKNRLCFMLLALQLYVTPTSPRKADTPLHSADWMRTWALTGTLELGGASSHAPFSYLEMCGT